jgi:phage terminase small subunit
MADVYPFDRERKPLNLRQERFVDAYIQTGNRREAAIAAGYSPKSAKDAADKLMCRDDIREVYERKKADWLPEVDVTIADVVRELAAIAFHEPTDLFDAKGQLLPVRSWPARARRSVASFEIVLKNAYAGDGQIDHVLRVKFVDKTKALELLSRYLGMLVERKEIGGPGSFASLSDQELAARIHAASGKLAGLAPIDVKALPAGEPEQ